MLAVEVITKLSGLEAVRREWDMLAAGAPLPMMAPAFVVGWWKHLAPPKAELRAVVVQAKGKLVGIAPFYVHSRTRAGVGHAVYRLPGIEIAGRLAPLAAQGWEKEVSDAVAGALATCRPAPDLIVFDGIPADSPWTGLLSRASGHGGPGPLTWTYEARASPIITIHGGSLEGWLEGKSANFRGQMRRQRRKFAAAGGTARVSTADTLAADIDAFMAMHAARWKGRGRSSFVALGPGLPTMLQEAGAALLADVEHPERFRLQMLEMDGRPVSAQLFIGAGGHVLHVNGGWDERVTGFRLHDLAVLATIEDAFLHGAAVVDLGFGAMHHKSRFADDDLPIEWAALMRLGCALPSAWLGVATKVGTRAARSYAKQRVPYEILERYRRLRDRRQRPDRSTRGAST